VLGLLVAGVTRVPAVAAALDVDERTAADALRAALLALQVPNRTAATVHALRAGLRVPPQLATPA